MSVKDTLKTIPLFAKLDENALDKLAKAAKANTFDKGEIICEQANIGDCFYYIVSGAARAYIDSEHGEPIVAARLEAGQYYGEQALFTSYPQQQAPSIVALTKTAAIKLKHSDIAQILDLDKDLKRFIEFTDPQNLTKNLSSFLDNIQLIGKLISQSITGVQTFSDREILFYQDDVGDKAYYLLEGQVEIRIMENKKLKFRTTINSGLIFGELALLEKAPRKGTAIALGNVKVVAIDENTLLTLCKQNPVFRNFIKGLKCAYETNILGTTTQYSGMLAGKEALTTIYKLKKGKTVIASYTLDRYAFIVAHTDLKNPKRLHYAEGSQRVRDILLMDDTLVGVTAFGSWNDRAKVQQLVLHQIALNADDEAHFLKTGALPDITISVETQDILCTCMQVSYDRINHLVANDVKEFDKICQLTGATTVCGVCRPLLIELLGGDAWHSTEIIKVISHNEKVKSFLLKPINKPIHAYQAGQYIVVQAHIDGNWIARSYTLTSVADQNHYYEITVKQEDRGLFSRWLFAYADKQPVLRISQPQGNFTITQDSTTPIVYFVGGIGVTPAIAYARAMASANDKRTLHIDYSARQADDLIFHDELNQLQTTHANVSLAAHATDEEGEINEDYVIKLLTQFKDADIYICGPKLFMDFIINTVTTHGIPKNKIFMEEFVYAGGPLSLKPW